ncbi:MAG: serine/threonine-protein kinase [Planctomycetota bacterium]
MPRSRLGPLAIESKLGDYPSLSSVWRAIHLKKQKAIAVKIFSVPFGGTPETRADFSAEWNQLKTLQHPGVARCYGGGFEQNDAYLAYELIDGETLSATLERRERLPWEMVLDFAEPIVDALEYLHSQSVHYGRLRPEKIIVSGLSPILVDVRTSRDDGPYHTSRPPTSDDMLYRPPESIDDPTMTSPRGDLYSFGAVMYRCLTGRAPFDGDTVEQVQQQIRSHVPTSPATIVMDCPVWLDKLVNQLLQKDAMARPNGASAVKLALGEIRKRSMSRAGVAEHVSSGFSPLQVTSQKEKDEARALLGRELVDLDEPADADHTSWHDKSSFLLVGLAAMIGVVAWALWPLNENDMRDRAEQLLDQGTRSSLIQAKISYLEPMEKRFPDGEHVAWVQEQIDRVEMVEAEHLLSVKMKRNMPLTNEGERLYAEAERFERFGDVATALDQYRSIVTLMSDQEQYEPFVNLARRQIAAIEGNDQPQDEAAKIIQAKLSEADRAYRKGNVVAARRIWYSIVDLYGNNMNVAPLVEEAQLRASRAVTK